MTLVNARAAFEKAVTDAVAAADNTVEMVYDNVHFTTPGKSKKYILMSVEFYTINTTKSGSSFRLLFWCYSMQCLRSKIKRYFSIISYF